MRQILIVLAIIAVIGIAVFALRNQKSQNQPVDNSPGQTVNQDTNGQPGGISKGEVPKIPLKLPEGFSVRVFTDDVTNARDLQFSPGGTLLVSSPARGSVFALPDKNKDGVADSEKTILSGKDVPHGLAFFGDSLYVVEVEKVVKYKWDEAKLEATEGRELFSLPSNNNHNRRTITFDKNGRMFVSVGSTCNVCNEKSELSATVITADADGNGMKVYAKGLRNAPFLEFNPSTAELWSTEMGRDLLGDNIPPDEIDIIKEGKDYGWPNCYANKTPDLSFNQNASCGNTEAPVFEIPAHSAPLGLTFITSDKFPEDWQGDLLVAYHGSWNRSTPTGYKVVRLNVNGNSISQSEDFLTGFIPSSARSGSDAQGRPADVEFDANGNLFVSDDKAGAVYIIQKQ